MSEQKLIKKQLIKNMFYTFIVFAIILIFFDAIIYNQVSISLYKSIDEELLRTANSYENRDAEKEVKKNIPKEPVEENKIAFIETKINPRLICIIRGVDGDILNSENIGRFYDDYITDIIFDQTTTDRIYSIKVQDTYNYRGITLKSVAISRTRSIYSITSKCGWGSRNNKEHDKYIINRKLNNSSSCYNKFIYIIKNDIKTNNGFI